MSAPSADSKALPSPEGCSRATPSECWAGESSSAFFLCREEERSNPKWSFCVVLLCFACLKNNLFLIKPLEKKGRKQILTLGALFFLLGKLCTIIWPLMSKLVAVISRGKRKESLPASRVAVCKKIKGIQLFLSNNPSREVLKGLEPSPKSNLLSLSFSSRFLPLSSRRNYNTRPKVCCRSSFLSLGHLQHKCTLNSALEHVHSVPQMLH